MLQQAGFKVQSKVDAVGPYWLVMSKSFGRTVVVEPVHFKGIGIFGVKMGVTFPMPAGGLEPAQLNAMKSELAPYVLRVDAANHQLILSITYENHDSNPKELANWVESLVIRADRADYLLKGLTPPVVTPAPPADPDQIKASCNGKYFQLLKVIEVPNDQASYGAFNDYGWWYSDTYAGFTNLPGGYWVYVAPKWYIWGGRLQLPQAP